MHHEESNTFVVRPTDSIKLKWDIVVMVCAIFNCFTIPLKVAFEPPQLEKPLFNTINFCVDLIFLFDMIINFRTTYIDSHGQEVTNPWSIARNYLKFNFWVDLLATIPIDSILHQIMKNDNPTYELFGILKLGRLNKLKKIISYLNVVEDVKQFMNLMKLVFFIVIYIHCFACTWWYMIRDD